MNKEEINRELIDEIVICDESTLSSLSDTLSYEKENKSEHQRKESIHTPSDLSTRRNSEYNTPINDTDSYKTQLMYLAAQNKQLLSDKALLEIDLLETRQEHLLTKQKLKSEIHMLQETKAKDVIELCNIIISIEKKMKDDQMHFIDLFAKKDEKIANQRNKIKSLQKSLQKLNQEVRQQQQQQRDNESICPSICSRACGSIGSSSVMTQLEKSTHAMVTLQNDLNSIEQRKKDAEISLQDMHRQKRIQETQMDGILKKKESTIATLTEKLNEQDTTIGRLLFVNSTMKMDEYKNQLSKRIDCMTQGSELEKLQNERAQNVALIKNLKGTVDSLCEALNESNIALQNQQMPSTKM